MRRKIELYIGGELVDLDEQAFILMNYTMEDLSNPTIVKNSFSQQITLKGTERNNRVFGEFFRSDRQTYANGIETGTAFNASRKTPFSVYDDMGGILESGYIKLDEVIRNGADISYKLTLHGILGSFIYSLAYNGSGDRMTLADLDYLGNGDPAELDFVINAANVKQAWDDLLNGTASKFQVINFCPAYNGIPEGNFAPDKGLVLPSDVGLQDSITKDGVTYTTKSGYALVNLASPQDEWAVKDFRSYLQRPCLSIKAFLEAICNPANNGGYDVDISSLSALPFNSMWLTLPMIPSIGTFKQKATLTLTMSSPGATGTEVARYDIHGNVPFGAKVVTDLRCSLSFHLPAASNIYNTLALSARTINGRSTLTSGDIIFAQAVAYASDDTIVGGSRIKWFGVKVIATGRELDDSSLSQILSGTGFVPVYNAEYERVDIRDAQKVSTRTFQTNELSFQVEAQDVAYYKIYVTAYGVNMRQTSAGAGQGTETRSSFFGDGTSSLAALFATYETSFVADSAKMVNGSSTITMTDPSSIRSGAMITKRMLLSSSHTPADYLLSLCKMFGLSMLYDSPTRKITIVKRNDLYVDETIDLTEKVDTSRDISIQPLVFDSKWMRMTLDGVGGAFMDEYRQVEGIDYGMQLIDTGFDFNSEIKDLMDKVCVKNACSVLASSRYFNYIRQGQTFIPSPFLDKGNTYTLWDAAGNTIDTEISCPPTTASVTYYNNDYPGYDIANDIKLGLAGADGKPVDGSDILVFQNGFDYYAYFKVTDDIPAMDTLNDGVPCWLIEGGDDVLIPIFSRYSLQLVSGNMYVAQSLDFGVPRQMDIPGIFYREDSTIYARYWKKYLTDRYDLDTRKMTCFVHFGSLQVGQDLLRKFFYYDNSLWVLNAIRNYSLTTYDPVECEFIKVQDKDNYLNGQTY